MNLKEFSIATENMIFSSKDYTQNIDKWRPGPNNILYVTGLSGSGKSTLAEEYEKKYHAHMFELDGLQHNYDSSGKGILEKCKEKFPGFQDVLKSGHRLTHDEVGKLRNVIKYIENICKEDSNTLYIIEGVQLFYWFDPDEFKAKPMIIKGTASIKSAYRANARDKSNGVQKGTLSEKIKQSVSTDKRLSSFKKELKSASESSLKSDIDPNYTPNGELKLSNFRAEKISSVTKEMKESPITFLKHVNVDRDSTYIWYDGKDIVGLGSVRYNDPNHNWVTAIQVNPKYRGNGLGDQILDFCVKTLKGNALAVASDNKIAFEMYRKRGFKVSKESLDDVKSGKTKSYFMYLK